MRERWNRAVELALPGQPACPTIRCARDAATCLIERWPLVTGPAYRRALRVCLGDDRPQPDGDIARSAFIAAAREADIAVHEARML